MGDPRFLPPDPPPERDEIRPSPFSNAAINAALDAQLGRVGPGETVAFVAVAEMKDGKLETKMTVNVRIGGGFSFAGFMEGDVKRPLRTVGAELRFSW